MRKVFIEGPYNVQIKDVPIPTPGPGELLIKTEYSGISAGTEMMLYCGTFPNFKLKKWPQWQEYPVCPGYELIGTVVAIGEEAGADDQDLFQIASLGNKGETLTKTASDFKVGDRVMCLGEHGEYACLPAEFVSKIPDNLSSEEATLAALGTTSMHAIRRAAIEYGDTVVIIGAGVLGNLILQQIKIGGARRVIMVDKDNARLEIAKKCGADLVLNPDNCDLVAEVLKYNGILADVVIEASGARGTEQTAMELVRDRGKVVIDGWHTDEINFQFGDFYFKELTLIVCRAGGPESGLPYSYVRYTCDLSRDYCLELLADGKMSGKHIKQSIFKAEDIKKAYDMIANRDPELGMQALLKWD